MNFYMTSGTPDFMQSLKKKYPNEELFLLHGTGNSVLIHESSNKTVFQAPRKYEILESAGQFSHTGYFVLQYIPISDEGKTIFDHKYTNLSPTAQNEPGFIALRVLKPIKSETYIILSQWSGPSSYEVWEKAVNLDFSMIADKQNLFTSAPYISTYQSIEGEEAF